MQAKRNAPDPDELLDDLTPDELLTAHAALIRRAGEVRKMDSNTYRGLGGGPEETADKLDRVAAALHALAWRMEPPEIDAEMVDLPTPNDPGHFDVVAELAAEAKGLDLNDRDDREVFRARVEYIFRYAKVSALRRYVREIPSIDVATANRVPLGRSKHEVIRSMTDRFESAQRNHRV